MQEQRRGNAQLLTHKHNAHNHNSLAEIENGLGREQRKSVLIYCHTLTHKHNAHNHNSLAKVESGMCREQRKSVLKAILQGNSSQLTD